MQINLDKRLAAVASLVTKGSTAADVGTDHAYLAAYLVQQGICPHVLATDIHEGPLQVAAKTVACCGLQEQITLRHTNGLAGVAADCADTIMIAGMGGELIADIVEAAPWLCDAAKHLVLQPMTNADALRRRLYAAGFAIEREAAVADTLRGHIYCVISARYSGNKTDIDDAFAYIGRMPIGDGDTIAYMQRQSDKLAKISRGLQRSTNSQKQASAERYAALSAAIRAHMKG